MKLLPNLVLFILLAFRVPATTFYVNVANPAPATPYTNWATAATNIQDAIDVATNGDTVLVTNGIYENGGRLYNGMTNRVAITWPIILQSVNGPGATVIQGYPTIGINAVRCVFLCQGAVLSGFTLTNGATLGANAVNPKLTQNGGGVYCQTFNSVLSNCIVSGNAAYNWGGGVESGTLNNCKLIGNSAWSGGGAYLANLNNCTLISNSASASGGGAVRGQLNNCTLVGNSANSGGGVDGDSDGTLNNCIIFGNTAAVDSNYTGIYTFQFTVNSCCTTPLATNGLRNITNNPVFINSANCDFHRIRVTNPV